MELVHPFLAPRGPRRFSYRLETNLDMATGSGDPTCERLCNPNTGIDGIYAYIGGDFEISLGSMCRQIFHHIPRVTFHFHVLGSCIMVGNWIG